LRWNPSEDEKGKGLKDPITIVNFPNPPIAEALLDIRADLPQQVSLTDLEKLYEHVRARFPEKQQWMTFQAGFKLSKEGPQFEPSTQQPVGYFFRSPTEKKVVQVRLDGFGFNKLRPYESWKLFIDEARRFWELYCGVAHPLKVKRISLRYINRIEAPLPMKDFKDYITNPIEIPPDLPQGVAHFFVRVVLPNPETSEVAFIIQTMEKPLTKLPLILDIEVFRETDYAGDNQEMWDHFASLRKFKNEIFFGTITEKTKELFE
jgi:uncharacterized protein (TIGR04255 family)